MKRYQVGIIGGTGSGKSTLVNLIPRFYDVTAGRVLVDGVDVLFNTFAKSMAGIGAFVSGPRWLINLLRYNMRSQLYAKSLPMPMTSPVECISGPRMMSTPGKRWKGSTASLTQVKPPRRMLQGSSSSRVLPSMTWVAM
mgnify:CR=1 FL=1